LSVSDVVVVKNKPYYVDTFGFKELKTFKDSAEHEKAEEHKKSASKKHKR
jgi:hypothetical protein